MSIYTVYATRENLAEYLGVVVGDLPVGFERLLERASHLVKQAILTNFKPLVVSHVEAVKLATCSQVEFWLEISESMTVVGGVKVYKLGDLTVEYKDSFESEKLCPRAVGYLNQAGLLYRGCLK